MKQSIRPTQWSMRGFVVGLGLTLAATGLTGCFTAGAADAAGATVAWNRGQLETNLDRPIDAVFGASQKALAQLEFANVTRKKSSVDAQLVSRTTLDKKVEITLQKVADHSTKVIIRVGIFGDETLSMSILDKIKAAL